MDKNNGSALLIVLFLSIVSLSIVLAMMQLSSTKSNMAINDKYDLKAFYAAEAGVNEAINVLNGDPYNGVIQKNAEDLNLPYSPATAKTLDGANYYVSISYPDPLHINIESVGTSKHASKKIRINGELDMLYQFTFGLLAKKTVNINTGNITYGLDLHGNGAADVNEECLSSDPGLDFQGDPNNYNAQNNSKATQSCDQAPTSVTNNYGGYIPAVDVQPVRFDIVKSKMKNTIDVYAEMQTLGLTCSRINEIPNISNTNYDIYLSKNYLTTCANFQVPTLTSAVKPDMPSVLIARFGKDILAFNTQETFSLFNSKSKDYLLKTYIETLMPKNSLFYDLKDLVDYAIIPAKKIFCLLDIESYSISKEFIADAKVKTPTPTPTQIHITPTPTPIPPTPTPTPKPTSTSCNGICLPSGDHNDRIYLIDNAEYGNININSSGTPSNLSVFCTGNITFNGADKETAIPDSTNTNYLVGAGGDIVHNGYNFTNTYYWLNGSFTQNGNSNFDNGKVMAQGDITVNGRFALTNAETLKEFEYLPKKVYIRHWQEQKAR